MKEHYIKILPAYFHRITLGQKLFEVRKNDRDYQVGDILTFNVLPEPNCDFAQAYPPPKFEIIYIHYGLGMQEGYCVLGLRFIPLNEENNEN